MQLIVGTVFELVGFVGKPFHKVFHQYRCLHHGILHQTSVSYTKFSFLGFHDYGPHIPG